MRDKFKQSLSKRVWLWLLLGVAVTGGAWKYLTPEEGGGGSKSSVQTVTTVVLQKRDFPVVLDATGNTVASNIVDIRPQVTNVVAKIHIKEGQRVQAGDLLFTLDDRADRANYDKAQALANDARRQYERAQELQRQQFVTQSAVDTAQANAQSAEAAARAAQATLSYDAIRSPITGCAGVINVFPGSLVQPGNTVSTTTSATTTSTQGAMVTIAQLNPMNVQFTVPESAVSTLLASQQAGEALTINFQTSDGKKREGKVYVIDNQVDAAIGAVKVKAQVDNKDDSLLPGQFVHLQLKAGTLKDVLVVPSQAVVTNQRGEQVYVVDAENVVQLKPIKVVLQGQGMSVITGVNEGDRIVVEGKQNLRPNGKVKEAEKPAAKDSAKAASNAASAASASPPAASAASAAGSQP